MHTGISEFDCENRGLHGQGADVPQAKHVETDSGESPVLMHHVGYLGGQVGAGGGEHLTHVRRPGSRVLLHTITHTHTHRNRVKGAHKCVKQFS